MGWLVLAAIAWTVVCLVAGIAVGARIGKWQAGWYDTGAWVYDGPGLPDGYDPPSASITPPYEPRMGWHVIHGADLLGALRRCSAGEGADVVFAEMWANAEHEDVPPTDGAS